VGRHVGFACGTGPSSSWCARRGGHRDRLLAARLLVLSAALVDRRKPGSRHHLITDTTGIPWPSCSPAGTATTVTRAIPPIRGVASHVAGYARIYADRGYEHRRLARACGIKSVIVRSRHLRLAQGLPVTTRPHRTASRRPSGPRLAEDHSIG